MDTQPFKKRLLQICHKKPMGTWLTLFNGSESIDYNYRELLSRINDYCIFYKEKGVRGNDSVLIILKESLDLYASFFAGIICGALPAYFAYPSPKQTKDAFLTAIDSLVEFNEIKLVLGFDEVIDTLKSSSRSNNISFLGYELPKHVESRKAEHLEDVPEVENEGFLQFSSGTTGAKKGVKISTTALFNQINAYRRFINYDKNSRVVSWLPHYHDMGLIACMLMPFFSSVPIVMMSPFGWVRKPSILLDCINQYRGTHVWLPNFSLGHLTKHVMDTELDKYDLSCIKQLICCSEPVLKATYDMFMNKYSKIGISHDCMQNCYAMAENTFAMSSTERGPITFINVDKKLLHSQGRVVISEDGKPVACVGECLPNVTVEIYGDNSFLGEDRIGEIVIKSDCMLDGYHNNETATRKAMLDNYFRTGDTGFLHKGRLYILNRNEDIIIVGGENIYPEDIELIVNEKPYAIPGRKCAFGIEDENTGTERVIVLVETKRDVSTDDALSLRADIFNTLNISVADIIFLPHMTLLKGTAGKISRYLNKDKYVEGAFEKYANKRKNSSDSEILEIIYSSLNFLKDGITINENTELFDSGIIDSLEFHNLIIALESHFSILIPDSMLSFEYFSTIEVIKQTVKTMQKSGKEIGEKRVEDQSPKETKARTTLRNKSLLEKAISGLIPARFVTYLLCYLPGRVGIILRSVFYKCYFKKAGRFNIRSGVIIDGMENIELGDNVSVNYNSYLYAHNGGKLKIGDNFSTNSNIMVNAADDGVIIIGNNCAIGPNSVLRATEHKYKSKEKPIIKQGHTGGVIILGDDVWIASNCVVAPNTEIRKGVVVSSCSLVKGIVAEYSLISGVPAKLICKR